MKHESSIVGALLTKDEQRILSWSTDKTLRLWDVATGQQIGPPMRHAERFAGALLTKDEQLILSWSWDGTLRLWDIRWPNGTLLEIACALLPDSDLTGVSMRYGIKPTNQVCQPGRMPAGPNWSAIEHAPAE
jgi:WD40 repeat protein